MSVAADEAGHGFKIDREALAERRPAKTAGQDGDDGDADLHRREEPARVALELEGDTGSLLAPLGGVLQAGLA